METYIILVLAACSALAMSTIANVDPVKLEGNKHFNYLRLLEGECHNCSTYKCTSHKANLGGADWCIMLFPDAIAHCNSDPECGGYTMTTADWFHEKYDKNGQVAVHLTKAGQKPMPCPSSAEWSSYEKQNSIRTTPITYGRSTCEDGHSKVGGQVRNFQYKFLSQPDAVVSAAPFSCKNHPSNLGAKDAVCILPVADAITLCNANDECEGFMINADKDWQKKYARDEMQAVQLFGKGAMQSPTQTWRIFSKQH